MPDPGRLGLDRLDLEDPRWVDFVAAQPDATPFHHPRWAAFLADCYGMRAFALAQVSDAGSVQAGLPVVEVTRLRRRRWISLPYTDRLAPLLGSGPAGAGLAAALEATRRSSGVDAVELRSALPGAFAEDAAWLHLLRLDPDPDRVAAGMRSNVGRNIRKADSIVLRDQGNYVGAFVGSTIKVGKGALVQARPT